MASPPAKCAEHHHHPRLIHNTFRRALLRHVRRDRRQIVKIEVRPFGDPFVQTVTIPCFPFAHVTPRIAPVVDGVSDVGGYEIEIDELLFGMLQFNEILCRLVPVGVNLFQKDEASLVALLVGFDFAFPFAK